MSQCFISAIGFMKGITVRMNFVNGDMKMLMIGIMMFNTDSLMVTKPNSGTQSFFNISYDRCGWVFSWGKRNNQMIGFVTVRSLVLSLNRLYFLDGPRLIMILTVCYPNRSYAFWFTLRIAKVIDKFGKTTLC